MDESKFWRIVGREPRPRGGVIDLDLQAKEIVKRLSTRNLDDIYGFELALRDRIRAADCSKVQAALRALEGEITDDGYLYFRAGLISLGRRMFYEALESPDKCARDLPRAVNGEPFLYIADEAFRRVGHEGELPRELGRRYYDYDKEYVRE